MTKTMMMVDDDDKDDADDESGQARKGSAGRVLTKTSHMEEEIGPQTTGHNHDFDPR